MFNRLENDSPSRGRKLVVVAFLMLKIFISLENDSPSRGRKHVPTIVLWRKIRLENDSPSRGRKLQREEQCLPFLKFRK